MNKIICTISGLRSISAAEKGRVLLYLVAFVPMIYKLISPFFIIMGMASYTVVIIPTMVILGIIMSWENLRESIRPGYVLFYFFIAFVLYLNPLFYPRTQELHDENYWPFIYSVLPFVFIGLMVDFKRDKYLLRFVARIGVIEQIFWQMCLLTGLVKAELGTTDSLGEQMETAYQLLFPIFILYSSLTREKNIIDVILAIIGTSLLFFMGARGPIVVYAIFVVGYFVFFRQYSKNALIKRVIAVTLFAVFYYYMELIILAILPIAMTLGFSTRVFDSILDDKMVNMQESSNRDDFYGNVINVIINDNGFGHGWLSDRLFTPTHGYVHNFELELLCQYGYIGGTLLLLCIAYYMFRRFLYAKTEGEESIWYMFFCSGFLALQFSYTYVKYPLFFVFVGYIINRKCCGSVNR